MPGGSANSLGYMQVNGGMVFNYADVYVKNAYIGPARPAADSTKCEGTSYYCAIRSFVNTYNTNWYLRDANNNRNNLYLASGCYIGVPSGRKDQPFDRSKGSKILLSGDDAVNRIVWMNGLVTRLQRRNSENDDDCWGGGGNLTDVVYLTPNGSVVKYAGQNNGYNNPICVGIGHHDSRYNVVAKWSTITGISYPSFISGGIPVGLDGNHGCVACIDDHNEGLQTLYGWLGTDSFGWSPYKITY